MGKTLYQKIMEATDKERGTTFADYLCGPEKYTEAGIKIGELAAKVSGCSLPALIDLLEYITDEKIPKPKGRGDRSVFKKFVAFTPTADYGTRSYPVGKACICWDNGAVALLQADGSKGNALGAMWDAGFVRLSTPGEIRAFCEEYKDLVGDIL